MNERNETDFRAALAALPLVAILRGLAPAQADAIGDALVGAGWRLIEIPLNSPDPLQSIARMAARFPQTLVGAGTVLHADAVRAVRDAGGRLIVAPNFDAAVVRAARELGMIVLPGVMTPSEAFAALAAGAHGLKLFPAEMIPPEAVKAMRAVLDPATIVMPVGGISPQRMAPYLAAGANGFGIGSAIYRPGDAAADVQRRAVEWVDSYRGLGRAADSPRG